MFLEILSAEEKIFSGEVESIILPGSNGQFQILNNHATIINTLTTLQGISNIPITYQIKPLFYEKVYSHDNSIVINFIRHFIKLQKKNL